MKYLDENKLENAKHWFESLGYHADISYGTLYLELESFSVELSESEIEARAEQWLNELNRQD
jgi:hypothetical protein